MRSVSDKGPGVARLLRPQRPFRLARGRESTALAALFAVTWLLLAGYALHALVGLGGRGTDSLFEKWINDVIVVLAAAACLWRGLRVRRERLAWLLLSLGMSSWVAGNIWYSLFVIDENPLPIPSIADGLWLGLYPPTYVALALLIGRQVRSFRSSLALDALIGALSAAAISSAIVLEAVLGSAHRQPLAETATNVAYPIGDMILLVFVFVSLAFARWRPERRWGYLGAGLLTFMLTDSLFLVKTEDGTYTVGTFIDAGWLLAAVLVAVAAWQPLPARAAVAFEGQRVLLAPMAFGVTGLGVLVWDHFERLNGIAIVLASAATLLVFARLTVTFVEKARMLARSRADATSDPLTGLGNRRKLLDDLPARLVRASSDVPLLFVLLDLDGFKTYNDLYGHPAGDALLARLGRRLAAAVGPAGAAYRMGGDEFCALLPADGHDCELGVRRLGQALTESGERWTIRASSGYALAPLEGATGTDLLRIADSRMYAVKERRLPASNRALGDVLDRLSDARDVSLTAHSRAVADLAEQVAVDLELAVEEIDHIRLAAQLHDIGKLALPDTIGASAAPLSPDDWLLVRRHTLVGARILSGTSALVEVARLVRSSHERWDGTGYPDGLGDERIPLGSRIIFCCDAYDAMTRGRPYQRKATEEEALEELRRCAGSQFDPDVVDAFERVVELRSDRKELVAS